LTSTPFEQLLSKWTVPERGDRMGFRTPVANSISMLVVGILMFVSGWFFWFLVAKSDVAALLLVG
jgi:hypothetical protein